MPDYEVELCIYDPVNPQPTPLGEMPDRHIIVLVTAPDDATALDCAVAHVAAQSYPTIAWQRFDHSAHDVTHPDPNATIDRVTWFDPARDDHQIWLELCAELPPGDKPAEAWKPTYDVRAVKHPFVRTNQRQVAEFVAIDSAFKSNPEMQHWRWEAVRAVEGLAEALEYEMPNRPPDPKPN